MTLPWEIVDFTWVTDSNGELSLHKNEPNLNFKDSYLGHIVLKGTTWGYVLKDKEFVACVSYADALNKIKRAI